MRKSLITLICLCFLATLFSGCMIVTPRDTVHGSLYSDYKGGLVATSNPNSSKVGKAFVTSILGLVATGDGSIETAAKNGGITKIHHVDHEVYNVLGIYAKFTTVVYGE